jgi:uncharacterized protein (TIGR02594 family)
MADTKIVLAGCMHLPYIAARAEYRDWRTLWEANKDLKKKRKNPLILFHGDKNNTGDTVVVPKRKKKSKSRATKTHSSFKTVSDKVFLRLRILDENLEPLKDAKYILHVGSKRYPDTGEGEFEEGGMINVEVSKQAQNGRLVVRYKQAQDDTGGDSGGGGASGSQSPTAPTGQSASAPSGGGGSAPEGGDSVEATEEPSVIEMIYELEIGALNPIQEKAPDDKCLSGVQQRLNNLGFDAGVVDGIDGPNTQGAVRRFQTKFQLTVNGQADTKTQKALYDFHDQPGTLKKQDSTTQSSTSGTTTNESTASASSTSSGSEGSKDTKRPPWIPTAEAEIGVKEVKGSEHNERVVEYHSTTTLQATTDETPWCSSFVNWVMKQAGHKGTNSARAIDWAKWGRKLDRPAYGAIAVFRWNPPPDKKGHVGFVVGRKGSRIELLGGNQGNEVKVQNYGTSKIIAYVVPSDYEVPEDHYSLGPYAGPSEEGTFASTR